MKYTLLIMQKCRFPTFVCSDGGLSRTIFIKESDLCEPRLVRPVFTIKTCSSLSRAADMGQSAGADWDLSATQVFLCSCVLKMLVTNKIQHYFLFFFQIYQNVKVQQIS